MVQIFIIIFATLIVSCTSKPNTESLSCNQFFGEFQTQDSSFTWRLELLENGYAKYSQLDNTQVRINRDHSTMIMLLFIPVLSGDGDRLSIGTRVH